MTRDEVTELVLSAKRMKGLFKKVHEIISPANAGEENVHAQR